MPAWKTNHFCLGDIWQDDIFLMNYLAFEDGDNNDQLVPYDQSRSKKNLDWPCSFIISTNYSANNSSPMQVDK